MLSVSHDSQVTRMLPKFIQMTAVNLDALYVLIPRLFYTLQVSYGINDYANILRIVIVRNMT